MVVDIEINIFLSSLILFQTNITANMCVCVLLRYGAHKKIIMKKWKNCFSMNDFKIIIREWKLFLVSTQWMIEWMNAQRRLTRCGKWRNNLSEEEDRRGVKGRKIIWRCSNTRQRDVLLNFCVFFELFFCVLLMIPCA